MTQRLGLTDCTETRFAGALAGPLQRMHGRALPSDTRACAREGRVVVRLLSDELGGLFAWLGRCHNSLNLFVNPKGQAVNAVHDLLIH